MLTKLLEVPELAEALLLSLAIELWQDADAIRGGR